MLWELILQYFQPQAYSGIGFALPSNIIRKIVSSLIATDSYPHAWLGAFGIDIIPDIAEALGLCLSQGRGVSCYG
jgi:serine protease Do